MKLSIGAVILCVLLVVLLPGATYADWIKPSDWILSRQKRLSDQRLAEIEALLALQEVRGIAVPVGFGKVDPAVLGRRRRSISENDLGKPLRSNTKTTADQSDQSRHLPSQQNPQEAQRGY